MADHLAHGAFGDRLHGALGLLDVEQIVAGAVGLDQPEHREIHVHDVLVAGEHQAFFRHVDIGGAAARRLDGTHADIDPIDARDLGGERGLDRIGHMEVEAGLGVTHVFAEAQHDAELVRIDPEEAGKSPDHDRDEGDQRDPLAAEIARQGRAQPVLAAAQELLEIGRLRALGPGSPRPAVLIVPLHPSFHFIRCALAPPPRHAGAACAKSSGSRRFRLSKDLAIPGIPRSQGPANPIA